uniref:non-specific serine/threonine protein kinase n=1 Tax=Cacopsylla melanoneura TaxID=428564 RepID=A0A8D8RKT6_9HEMI
MTMSVPMKTEHDVRDVEIRHLPHSIIQKLGHMLDQGNLWKNVMAIVKLECDPKQGNKYDSGDIQVIATYATDNRCTAMFLDEWGTSGRRRPRVSTLVQHLEEEKLYQAASFLRKAIFDQTISYNDDADSNAQKWLEEKLKAKEMADEEKRQREEREEERRDRAEDLIKRLRVKEGRENEENRGEKLQTGHAKHAHLEADVNDNRIGNGREGAGQATYATVLQNGVEKACTHLKETIAVDGNKGNHLVGNQVNGDVENGHAKEAVHQEPLANGIDIAHRGPVRSNNIKRVSFHLKETAAAANKETAAAGNASNATERVIQDVLFQGRDVSNIAENERIEEESPQVKKCPKPHNYYQSKSEASLEVQKCPNRHHKYYRSYSEVTKSSGSQENVYQVKMPPTKKFSKPSGDLIEFPRHELYQATNGYNKENQLGAGVFGEVYYGKLKNGTEVAVKRLQSESNMTTTSVNNAAEDLITTLFNNEVQNLAVCKHTNLVRLLGYLVGNDMSCIVYEFMANGSLYDRLACMNDTPPLSTTTRCSIALDVAEGLKYLHTGHKPSVVHRDVKSMNILLNDRLEAKLGDFGIVRPMSVLQTQHTNQTAGTGPYMAPEAFQGEISDKNDVFAYGIVLLEILTGLKPSGNNMDGPLENQAIWIFFVGDPDSAEEGMNLVKQYLDVKANWDKPDVVDSLVEIAVKRCCPAKKKARENMSQIVDRLRKLTF